jgi:hypothetical protein
VADLSELDSAGARNPTDQVNTHLDGNGQERLRGVGLHGSCPSCQLDFGKRYAVKGTGELQYTDPSGRDNQTIIVEKSDDVYGVDAVIVSGGPKVLWQESGGADEGGVTLRCRLDRHRARCIG